MKKKKSSTCVAEKPSRIRNFQEIPHWNDEEIGYKALLREIRTYTKYKHDEFVRLAPVITVDEFIWDTFSNMCRRDGYPQYDKEKNRGNFHSYVQINCVRNQMDWAKKRNTRTRQLAKLQGIELTGDEEYTEVTMSGYQPPLELDRPVEGSDDHFIHEHIEGSRLSGYTDELALEEISKNISTDRISEKFSISWKDFATLLMKGWSVVDISKKLEVNPTTTRKYLGILKEQMKQDTSIRELLRLTGIQC